MKTTEEVLTEMLTEPTGAHILDSGGMYGRNWQHQQGRDLDSFMAEPEVTLDLRFDYLNITLSVFHFLRKRLDYSDYMQRMFEKYVALANEEHTPWYAELVRFADAFPRDRWGDTRHGCNSYNGEDWLSQIIQWESYEHNGEVYVGLQIHGGADARGGYTKPRFFTVTEELYDLYNNAQAELYCDALDDADPWMQPHRVEVGTDLLDRDGSFTTESDLWPDGPIFKPDPDDSDTWFVRCPYCTEPRPMRVYAL